LAEGFILLGDDVQIVCQRLDFSILMNIAVTQLLIGLENFLGSGICIDELSFD
jgi:hypothetical protein